ncbi:MAG: hypothetical protein EAZ53_01735 [Bacteroidetes bacterium]|nr:MAG: hypothetical protein EAZ53_01735 [Bacteroidota bacterium]
MKNFKIVFLLTFISNIIFCSATLPVQIGIQINPNIHFINTDSTQYVLKQTQWGTNVLLRIGFDISQKLSFGLGAGFGRAIETTDYGFYTYGNIFQNTKGYVTQKDKNVYELFFSQNIKSSYIFNPYFTYNFPIRPKFGFMLELGYKFKLTENDVFLNEKIDYKNLTFRNSLYFNEKTSSIYIRPTFYFDISSKIRLSLNYLNFGYSFGKRINHKKLFEELLPHYLIVNPRDIKIYPNRIITDKQDLFGQSYLNSVNQFDFLYGLSSLYFTLYVKI